MNEGREGLRSPILPKTVRVKRAFWLVTHEDVHDFPRVRAMTAFLQGLMKAQQNLLAPPG